MRARLWPVPCTSERHRCVAATPWQARHTKFKRAIRVKQIRLWQGSARERPPVLPAPCVRRIARANKFAEVIFETNRYFVPSRWAQHDAIVEVFDQQLRIIVGDQCVAEHRRCPGRNQTMLDVRHAVDLLAFMHRSVEHAEIIAHGRLPAPFLTLRDRLYAEDRAYAGRRFVTVLSLLELYPVETVGECVAQALALSMRHDRSGSNCATGTSADDANSPGGDRVGAALARGLAPTAG